MKTYQAFANAMLLLADEKTHELGMEKLNRLMQTAPSGSGIDAGTTLSVERSNQEMLVFTTAYHHMNDVGYYDGWTEHTITVRPSLLFEIVIDISGKDRNSIKDYLTDVFQQWLTSEFDWAKHLRKKGETVIEYEEEIDYGPKEPETTWLKTNVSCEGTKVRLEDKK